MSEIEERKKQCHYKFISELFMTSSLLSFVIAFIGMNFNPYLAAVFIVFIITAILGCVFLELSIKVLK